MISNATEPGSRSGVVQVLLFAGLRERAGWARRPVPLAAGSSATPLTIWKQLQLDQTWRAASAAEAPASATAAMSASRPEGTQENPSPASGENSGGVSGGDGLPSGVRVAINQAFAAADTPLSGGDELAFLPPISGG